VNTKWRPKNKNEDASLHYLENFLREKKLYEELISDICESLRTLQLIWSQSTTIIEITALILLSG